jgi:hypothetical protein
MSAFTLQVRAEPRRPRKFFSGTNRPSGHFARKTIHAKRNRAYRSSLSGKRFDATEDRDHDRSAFAVQSEIEVMHPNSLSRERALEN